MSPTKNGCTLLVHGQHLPFPWYFFYLLHLILNVLLLLFAPRSYECDEGLATMTRMVVNSRTTCLFVLPSQTLSYPTLKCV